MIETIDGGQLAQMIISAAGAMEASRQLVNELNVFPVPDGDTGTNMSLTMSAAVAELRENPHKELCRAAESVAHGLLRGARGNSGVILSLLFRGFSKSVRDMNEISGVELAQALLDGVDAAYRAVMKPAEGTVLTVSRMAAARAMNVCAENPSVEYVLSEALDAANEALEETVNQNPVLSKAGVVDAGGKGYCIILDGMLAFLQGRAFESAPATEGIRREKANFAEYASEDIRFAYCTEFIVRRKRDNPRDPMKLRAFLGSIGDSLVFVDDDTMIKVHVHSNNPGKVLEESLAYGELTSIKIENMRQQHTDQIMGKSQPNNRVIVPPRRKYGFVSVCAGEGIIEVFKDLGVDALIEGGQTMNPSTEDILRQIDASPSEVVFVLPNNKNIIMAAEQCVPLSEKQVIVLPSKTIPQGMAALLGFDATLDLEQNREAMMAAMAAVTTGQITYAARESSFDGQPISEGDHLALVDGNLSFTHRDLNQVLDHLVSAISKASPTYINIFYGDGMTDADAQGVRDLFKSAYPYAEITLINGGQPVYYYLISAE